MRKPPVAPPGTHQPNLNIEADRRLIDVTQISNDWIWEQDAELRFTWLSPNADALGGETSVMIGKTRPEMAGASAADLASPEWQAHLACLASHQPFRDFIFSTRRSDGTTAWYRVSGVPLFDNEGHFAGYRGIGSNVTTFREREIAAAETTQKLETILAALPDLLFEVDAEGRYTGFMTGPPEAMVLPPEQLSGKRLDEVLPPDVAALTMDALARVMTGGTVRGLRYQLALPVGTHWFELAAKRKPAADAGGQATAILLVRDVTEDVSRRRAVARLGKIVETMTNLVAIIDHEHRVVWVNAAFTAQTGWRLDEIRGKDLGTLVRCPETDPDDTARLLANLASGKPYHGEAVNQDRHAKRYWVDFNVLPLFDESGAPDGFVSVETPITERKEHEARIVALASESQIMRTRLVNALEALSDGVVIFDDADRLVVANSAYRSIYPEIADDLREGISQADLLRLGLERGSFPAAKGREAEWLAEQQARYSAARYSDEVETVDGRWLHRLDMHTSDGGRIGLRIDITEEQATTRRLEQARAAAEAASLSKSSFLANMSHEIRTPLNGVLGMAELLEGIITEPRQKQMIGTIRRSGDLLLSILNSILDMSKIEAGKMELEQVPFDPVEITRQVEALNAVKAAEKGLDFEVMTNLEPGMNRIGDPHRIQQIVNNLIGNAIKFTETGAVGVTLSGRAGKPLVIEVSDTGVGMTEAQAARVFDSFVQADGTISRRFGGTGLGMTIVKELVTLMGGAITLESAPGRGSKVRVTLPLSEVPVTAPVTAADPRIAVSQSLAGLRLLAADDSATNRLVLREMLAGSGADLTLVENGLQAVDAWNAARSAGAPFDLLLLDISMPVLDGISALARMRDAEASAKLPATPAIALTANAMAHQVAEYIMAGFDSHLAKPFHQQELLHAILDLAKNR